MEAGISQNNPDDAGSPSPEGAAPPRTGIAGLDGFRGVAVLAVLFYHAHFGWMRGGYLGVEVFFVLSGFLITGLLLKERAAKGRIDLPAFWVRRLRRLLPALFLFVAVLTALGLVFLGDQAAQFRRDLFASLFYLENWYQIGTGSSYFADQGLPLLRHLWSLAVEGQFYLLWPFLVVGALRLAKGRVGPLAAGTALLCAGSFGLMIHFADPGNPSGLRASASLNRAYLGTDTRAFGLLAGALLAMASARPRALGALGPRAARALGLGALCALLALGGLMASTDPQGAFLYFGGFLLVDALTLLVIAALVWPSGPWTSRLLSCTPLVWVGQRSYGLYLWHWPVFRLLGPHREGAGWFLLRLALALVITELSYRYLEVPVRQGVLKRWFSRPTRTRRPVRWLALTSAAGALMATFALGAGTMMARLPAYRDPVEASIQAGAAALDHAGTAAAPPAPVPPPPEPAPARHGPHEVLPAIPLPETLKGLHITAIGDSVMKGAAPSLKKAGEACLGPDLIQINAEECRSFFPALEILRTYKREDRLGEVVVIHLGTNNSSLSETQFRALMNLLSDRRLVLFLTVKSDKTEACDTVNRALETLLAGYPNARIFDWRTASGEHPDIFYSDQTHLRPEGAQFYAGMIMAQIALHTRPAPVVAAARLQTP